jgi:hypothetical protein
MAFAADAPNGLSDKGVTILHPSLCPEDLPSAQFNCAIERSIPFPFAYVPLLGALES